MDVSQTLIILSASPSAVTPAEQFLVNRGWAVLVTGDEREALRLVVERRVSYFMISVEHGNRKTQGLHRLLKQTCPFVCVIYFAETNNIENYRRLVQIDHPFRIQPPLTGPSIERVVNRHQKDLRQKEMQAEIFQRSVNRALPGFGKTLNWAARGEESVLSRGVSQALDACLPKAGAPAREFLTGPTTNVSCIAIESEQFSGYLLTAMAGDHRLDEEFMELVRENLQRFLNDNGASPRPLGNSFAMKIRRVNFESWAADYAEFLKKAVHEGREIAMAFFPAGEVSALLGETALSGMVKIRVQDLVADENVDFNVYLFLPANQKHLLYTAKDTVFHRQQKERLSRGQVVELHLRHDELPFFQRYRARHRINSLIREFETRNQSSAM
ncbi:MAG: hypothetical protein KF802_04205 [Bdellovibrionaceae bacterium]|nr:hypothetical protein [Pseudobdellovibrionaceae bacterium]MBX3034238.1 hypothetical protein [Pseudobdellovibrionaceae bacterium]